MLLFQPTVARSSQLSKVLFGKGFEQSTGTLRTIESVKENIERQNERF